MNWYNNRGTSTEGSSIGPISAYVLPGICICEAFLLAWVALWHTHDFLQRMWDCILVERGKNSLDSFELLDLEELVIVVNDKFNVWRKKVQREACVEKRGKEKKMYGKCIYNVWKNSSFFLCWRMAPIFMTHVIPLEAKSNGFV